MDYLEENLSEDSMFTLGTYGGLHSELTWIHPKEGLPSVALVECGEKQPRTNSPRIKFCANKNAKTLREAEDAPRIPMMISDSPFIPESHALIEHNLTENELNLLKKLDKINKESLLDLGDGTIDIFDFCDVIRANRAKLTK